MAFIDDDRICKANTPLGADVLHFANMKATEALSALFSFEIEMVSTDRGIAFGDLIGQPMVIELDLPEAGKTRYFHGIIAGFSHVGDSDLASTYSAEVVPWMWILTIRENHRIFQNRTTEAILREVFEAAGMIDVAFELTGQYAERVYCVQYGETDFDFVSRLMEQEGIYYYFKHEKDQHTLVVSDSSTNNPACSLQPEAEFRVGSELGGEAGYIAHWSSSQVLHPGKFSLSDYNFTDPKTALLKTSSTSVELGKNAKYEVYEYPGGVSSPDASDAWSKVRMQERESSGVRARGQSTCRGFLTGHHFKVKKHFRDDVDDEEFLLTSVVHTISQGTPFEKRDATYGNHFECIPTKTTYRPVRKTSWPRIHGSQTAEVVGPKGDEIYTDEDGFGRIKVQFHWDRDGKRDEKSSCWIRVAQNWAGAKWGAVVLPRIGHEVVVSFLEGDPDRPLVTGCVYNADNMPPYDLPAEKTKTVFKSRSSKKGESDNFNEIRFEDLKGSEELYIHAEKDQNTVVENDQSVDIGHDQAIKIGNDRSLDVGNDKSEAVGNDKSISVTGNHSETIGKDETVSVDGASTVSITKDSTLDVSASRTISIAKNLTLTVSKKQDDTITEDYAQSVGGSSSTTIEKDRKVAVTGNSAFKAKKISIEAEDELLIKVGSAKIQMKKNGDIKIDGKKIQIKGSSDVILKGSKVLQN